MDKHTQQQIFDDWLARYKGLFFKVVRAYAFTAADQDDLFQEVAIQVWNSIPQFKGESQETTWIYRVALYSAISWSKREQKHRQRKEPLDGEVRSLRRIAHKSDSRLDWLYEQIEQLDEIDRSLTLLSLDGLSYREMASILGISESNVGAKLTRIKQHLSERSKESQHDGI